MVVECIVEGVLDFHELLLHNGVQQEAVPAVDAFSLFVAIAGGRFFKPVRRNQVRADQFPAVECEMGERGCAFQ